MPSASLSRGWRRHTALLPQAHLNRLCCSRACRFFAAKLFEVAINLKIGMRWFRDWRPIALFHSGNDPVDVPVGHLTA
jgi:hypothetical protein